MEIDIERRIEDLKIQWRALHTQQENLYDIVKKTEVEAKKALSAWSPLWNEEQELEHKIKALESFLPKCEAAADTHQEPSTPATP